MKPSYVALLSGDRLDSHPEQELLRSNLGAPCHAEIAGELPEVCPEPGPPPHQPGGLPGPRNSSNTTIKGPETESSYPEPTRARFRSCSRFRFSFCVFNPVCLPICCSLLLCSASECWQALNAQASQNPPIPVYTSALGILSRSVALNATQVLVASMITSQGFPELPQGSQTQDPRQHHHIEHLKDSLAQHV